jgi:glycosyltransferase involved in cell wall biosynthesis
MAEHLPRVSIGLPVFNGERFLAQALDSLLAQTFSDFEIVLSDNASTDATQEICEAYAARDDRIRYHRSQSNAGASRNFNRAFELATGEYFKWAAHDDLCAPEYLERCLDVLDRDASVILCHSMTREIDESGQVLRVLESKPQLGSPRPNERFYDCICVQHPQVMVFGLMRASVLRKTRLIGSYVSSDRTLLGELALRGRLHQISEPLFSRRDHRDQGYRHYDSRRAYQAWFDPRNAGKLTFPHWRLLAEHLVSVSRVPLSWSDRVRCYGVVVWWIRFRWRYLASNLVLREVQ